MYSKYQKAILYLISTYLGVGSIFSTFMFFHKYGILFFLNALLPASVYLIIATLSVISGWLLFKQANRRYESFPYTLSTILLFFQTVQIVIMGLSFKIYYLFNLAVGFTDNPDLRFVFNSKFVYYHFEIGKIPGSHEISLSLNFIPLIMIFFLSKINHLRQHSFGTDHIV